MCECQLIVFVMMNVSQSFLCNGIVNVSYDLKTCRSAFSSSFEFDVYALSNGNKNET